MKRANLALVLLHCLCSSFSEPPDRAAWKTERYEHNILVICNIGVPTPLTFGPAPYILWQPNCIRRDRFRVETVEGNGIEPLSSEPSGVTPQ
jgi:hypothetical protein